MCQCICGDWFKDEGQEDVKIKLCPKCLGEEPIENPEVKEEE